MSCSGPLCWERMVVKIPYTSPRTHLQPDGPVPGDICSLAWHSQAICINSTALSCPPGETSSLAFTGDLHLQHDTTLCPPRRDLHVQYLSLYLFFTLA